MVFKSIIGVTSICLAAVSFNARAYFISVDLSASGDGLITEDSVSGLQWLDLTETTNISFSYVTSQLGVGGEFEGWRVANAVEIHNFFDMPLAGGDYAFHNRIATIVSFWGDTGSSTNSNSNQFSYNCSFSDPNNTCYGYMSHVIDDINIYNMTEFADTRSINDSYSVYGTALVRAAPVPVPAAIWLFGSGLFGLIGIGRRKKAA